MLFPHLPTEISKARVIVEHNKNNGKIINAAVSVHVVMSSYVDAVR